MLGLFKLGIIGFWVACLTQLIGGDPDSQLTKGALYFMMATAAIHLVEYLIFVGCRKVKNLSHAKDLPMTILFGLVHLGPMIKKN